MTEPTAPSPARPGGRSDRLVILRGAAFGCLIAVPATLANSAIAAADDVDEGLLALSFLVVVIGFLVAGLSAGAGATDEPARHGALAGLATLVPVELLAILGRLDRGAPIRLGTIIVHVLLGACVAAAGAQISARRRARRATTAPQEGP